ncbi:MAG: 4Fe-4S dicluster domain-containing protein [Paludibacteraceae bacterium]|nr:4Fe-4S dicluster domain-containing protein [Paludibacteraceae bacterium]
MIKYFTNIFSGIVNLLKGMKVTGKVLISPAVTQPYPEKRDELKPKDRFRAELTMPHNASNEHKCTACGICAMNCPNQTIQVTKNKITDENGKPKIILDQYLYDIGSCIFCGLCTRVCPQGAIEFTTNFEHAVYTRSKLVKQLNQPGSKKMEVAKPAAAQQKVDAEPKQNNENNQ